MKEILTVFQKAGRDIKAAAQQDNRHPRETVHKKKKPTLRIKTYSHTGQHLSFKLGTQVTPELQETA